MEQNIDDNENYSNNNIENIENYTSVPVVTLRDVVVFPGTTVYFEVGREATVKAVNGQCIKSSIFLLLHKKTLK